MTSIYLLENTIQTYAWGSTTAIPELLGQPPDFTEPRAELWMGAHPSAPSTAVMEHGRRPLTDLITENPAGVLGKSVAERFDGRLPYLFKVLAAEKPLSIQAHPSKEQAADGYQRENQAGIPESAGHRNYKDPNHKPECICALTPFWAMVGFKPFAQTREILREILSRSRNCRSIVDEVERFEGANKLRQFFQWLMTISPEKKSAMIESVVKYAESNPEKDPMYGWLLGLHREYPSDVGLLSPIFLNLVRLEPGQALFLPAGELHAYLKGVGIELMANSDNVLRGGLTPKHVDVPELLTVLHFEAMEISILEPHPVGPCEGRYRTPAEEFALSVIEVVKPDVYRAPEERSVEILLCTSGSAAFYDSARNLLLNVQKGDSVLVPAAAPAYAIEGEATFYKAAVPLL